MNQKVTLSVCLAVIGLSVALAGLAVEAQLGPANTPAVSPPAKADVAVVVEKEDEEFMPDGEEDYLDEYDDEYEDEEELEEEYEDEDEEMYESSEEKLSELAEEHYVVKIDCQDLQNMIAQAKLSNETVDPELQESFGGCKQVLKSIEDEMRELTREILGGEDTLI